MLEAKYARVNSFPLYPVPLEKVAAQAYFIRIVNVFNPGHSTRATSAHSFAVDDCRALDSLELKLLTISVKDDERYVLSKLRRVLYRSLGATMIYESEFGFDGIYYAVPGAVILHTIPYLTAYSLSRLKAVGDFENLFPAEVASSRDTVPNPVVDPGGLIIIKQIDCQALAQDSRIIIRIFSDKIVE